MTTMNTEVLGQADQAIEKAADQAAKAKRKRGLIALGAAVLTIGTGYGAYSHFYASHFISTDNAYTAAETAQVTPSIGGIVREVLVTDTSYVHKGDVLVVLDDIDARLALAQAAGQIVLGPPVMAQPGHHDAMQGRVSLAVATPVEAMAAGLA